MKKLWMLFLPMFFWGCHDQPKTEIVKLQAEELEVIKQTLPKDTDIYWQKIKVHNSQISSKNIHYELVANSNKSDKIVWFVKDT
ncbi:MAG: hypothetical protein EOP42_33520, partial [Sphingobacteriaceae bacterium]